MAVSTKKKNALWDTVMKKDSEKPDSKELKEEIVQAITFTPAAGEEDLIPASSPIQEKEQPLNVVIQPPVVTGILQPVYKGDKTALEQGSKRITIQELNRQKKAKIQEKKAKSIRITTIGDVKKATYDLPVALHKRLKRAAMEADVDMVDIVIAALEKYLPKIEKNI